MEPIAQDPALSLRQRKQYWYFQMRSPAGLGVEATLAEINKKLQNTLKAKGLHSAIWERLEKLEQPIGDIGANLSLRAVAVHGLLRWGGRAGVRGRTLQKDHFGLGEPHTALTPCPADLAKELGRVAMAACKSGAPGSAREETLEAVSQFLAGQRVAVALLLGCLESDLQATGPEEHLGQVGMGGMVTDEAEEGDGGGNEWCGGGLEGMKQSEKMLAVKRMIDEGDRDVYDQIREQDYELYLNKGPAIQRDLARQLEKNARCDLIAYGDLWGWQKGVVHLATQTQPDDRHIDWYVDEAGGKV